MSPRWQPPHPDPVKRIEATPYSRRMAAERRRHTTSDYEQKWGEKCIWPECDDYADFFLNVRLCLRHANHVNNKVSAYYNVDDERLANEAEEVRAGQALSAQKLDAGQELNESDIAPGWVYYIRIGDTYKIGYARQVASRMRQYPPNAELLAVEPGTPKIEKARHSLFRAHLAYGREWFRTNPELDQWIAGLRAKHGDPSEHEHRYTTPNDRQPVVASKRANRRW